MTTTLSLVPNASSLPVPPNWAYDAHTIAAMERSVTSYQVTSRADRGTPRTCLIRFANEQDLDGLQRLNAIVLQNLPHPHIFRPEEPEYFRQHLLERGRCIVALCEGEIIAFTVLSFPRDDADNLGKELGFNRDERLRVCHFELSGVDPDFRGNELHIILNDMRARFAAAAGYHHLCATVSPRNPYSLTNHMSAGMIVRKLAVKYGGMDRYVIYRDHRNTVVATTAAITKCEYRDCLDIEGQQALIAEGYWGITPVKSAEGRHQIMYVPSNQLTSQPTNAPQRRVTEAL